MSKVNGQKADNTLELPDGTVLSYTPLVTFKCAFCGGIANMVEFDDASVGGTHTAPECAEFVAMDLVTFMRENRRIFEREIEEGKGRLKN